MPSHDSTVCTTTLQSVNRLSVFTVKVVGIVQLVVLYSVKFAVFKGFLTRVRGSGVDVISACKLCCRLWLMLVVLVAIIVICLSLIAVLINVGLL